MSKRKPCGRPTPAGPCEITRAPGRQRCGWHSLESKPIEDQVMAKNSRLAKAPEPHRPRVPASEWPSGRRWCAGCQAMVPLWYTSGSRCKACASEAAHAGRIEKAYGITSEEYQLLLRAQGGRCYVCHRKPKSKRLAVDHDHKSGVVRGLLCADVERGCNHSVLGTLEGSVDGSLAAARRVVEYLEDPPYAKLQRGGMQYVEWAERQALPTQQPAPF